MCKQSHSLGKEIFGNVQKKGLSGKEWVKLAKAYTHEHKDTIHLSQYTVCMTNILVA